jgi:hypothetical protein
MVVYVEHQLHIVHYQQLIKQSNILMQLLLVLQQQYLKNKMNKSVHMLWKDGLMLHINVEN